MTAPNMLKLDLLEDLLTKWSASGKQSDKFHLIRMEIQKKQQKL